MEKITDYLSYQAEVVDPENEGEMIPNPQGRSKFLLGKVKEHLRNCYRAQVAKEFDKDKATAMDTADTDLETLDVS